LAGGWGGDAPGHHDPEPGKERGQAGPPRGDHGPRPEEAGAKWPAGGEDEAVHRFGIQVTLRRVRINPDRKRREYLERLEGVIKACESAMGDAGALEEIQLKAMDIIIKAIRLSYVIVREVDIENLELQAEEIKRRLEERDRASQG